MAPLVYTYVMVRDVDTSQGGWIVKEEAKEQSGRAASSRLLSLWVSEARSKLHFLMTCCPLSITPK
jgi:hypothetical protein